VDESHVTVPQIGGMYWGDNKRKTTLTEYLHEHGIKVRYVHSDVETLSGSRSSVICGSACSTC
jgi:excinuclease UvrABC helicase subunit UvrB